ncbi:MAG: hypothetical protein JST46_03690 [Bacteroidetes bacterium]|nr:hypothetical protein [Bacteroidota bacterium]
MNESVIIIAVAFVGGLGLGLLFFAGLRLSLSRWNQKGFLLRYLVGFFLRMFLLLTGFYFLANGSWQRMLAVAVGFTLARFISQRFMKPKAKTTAT